MLDADSLMTGDTLVRLVAAMERNPQVGLIQTLPVMVNATTPFARVQQFAGRVYGPLIAHGLAWWHGADSNYWGHNAMIRTRAFAECGGLPVLSGPRPIGGHILSHDFVEAALMRRGGWAIHMAPALGGSFEESPPSLTEYAARDRRWCQGNLQHAGVLPARGLHWLSRLHLLTGIGSYITAPLWLLFLLTGILISLQAQFIRPEYFPKTFTLYPQWPAQDPVRAAYVFAATMGLLLAPKLIGYLAMLADGPMRRGFGGAIRAFVSMIAEVIISGLIAPVMMLIQSSSVAGILMGRDSGWNVQRRDDGSLPLRDVARRYGWHTAFGAAARARGLRSLVLAVRLDDAGDRRTAARDPAGAMEREPGGGALAAPHEAAARAGGKPRAGHSAARQCAGRNLRAGKQSERRLRDAVRRSRARRGASRSAARRAGAKARRDRRRTGDRAREARRLRVAHRSRRDARRALRRWRCWATRAASTGWRGSQRAAT